MFIIHHPPPQANSNQGLHSYLPTGGKKGGKSGKGGKGFHGYAGGQGNCGNGWPYPGAYLQPPVYGHGGYDWHATGATGPSIQEPDTENQVEEPNPPLNPLYAHTKVFEFK